MSFMEKVSTFFGLEDEEYADNYQREQNKKVAPQQNSAPVANKQASNQQNRTQFKASNTRPTARKPASTKAKPQPAKQPPQNTRTTGGVKGNESVAKQQAPRSSQPENNVVAMKSNQAKPSQKSQSGKITIIEPRAYSEAMTIAKYVIGGQSVLVNFRLIEEHQARRIVDFLTGTVYAEDGDIKRVSDEIFLCTPKEVEIDGTAQSLVENQLI
ncbi:MAG: cell division protein SepF [Tetragenococcus sp.]|nr:cell division protein SepF [Tetragenococcus sp.]